MFQILELNPRSANALMQLGIMDMSSPDPIKSQRAFAMIEKSFGRGVDKPVSRTFQQGSLLAGLAGRRRAHLNEYPQAVKFLTIGLEGNPADTCMALQLATVLSYYPKSVAEADRGYELYPARIDELLSRPASAALVRPEHLLMAGNNDPYSHCTLSLFVHSFYYRGDPASAALKHFQAATRAFPDLLYVAPHLTRQGAKKTKKGSGMKSSKGGNAAVARGGSCRRVKLGVASAFFSHASSVTDDFRGVMERLSRDVFEITFIYFMESATPPDPYILEKKDKHLLIDGRAPHWFESARRDIANLQLDVLLYLDLTMSTWIQKMAYSRLATVQATSHGHPVTSGVPKHIMQYYISWAAAELPYEEVSYLFL
jgi:tetratricopeptide (TPR) repeat protein